MYGTGSGGMAGGAFVSTGGALVAGGADPRLAIVIAVLAGGIAVLMVFRRRMIARRAIEQNGSR